MMSLPLFPLAVFQHEWRRRAETGLADSYLSGNGQLNG